MEIRLAGVAGAGAMGRGIAQLLAQHGIEAVVLDRDPAALEAGRTAIDADLHHQIERWGITDAERRAALGRLHFTTHLDELAPCGAVIEAIDEELDAKRELFAALDAACPQAAVIASNTSTLSITEIAAATRRPERCIGMHFAGPVGLTRVIEVVRGLKTSPATVEATVNLVEAVEKTPVQVYESPGYVTTRLMVPLLNEAMYVLMEGVATADGIDTAMHLGFDISKGPLEFADRIGLDTLLEMTERLWQAYGELKYRPCPLLRKLVRAGHLGVKSGEGFFRYTPAGDRLGPALGPGGMPLQPTGG